MPFRKFILNKEKYPLYDSLPRNLLFDQSFWISVPEKFQLENWEFYFVSIIAICWLDFLTGNFWILSEGDFGFCFLRKLLILNEKYPLFYSLSGNIMSNCVGVMFFVNFENLFRSFVLMSVQNSPIYLHKNNDILMFSLSFINI